MEAPVIQGSAACVRTFPDAETLGRAAADLFVTLVHQYSDAQKRFSVALSGGSSPKRMYELLGSPSYRDAIQWSQVHIFWADERCVPPEHSDNNYKLAYDAFLSHVPLPGANIHRIEGEKGPVKAALNYEKDLRGFFTDSDFPTFDLVLLGAGEDGHTASLFPGSSLLREKTRLAAPVNLAQPKRDRVTLTLPVLNHASHVLFLASGRAKAEILSGIFNDHNEKIYPAGLVRPVNGKVTWFIDRDAAEKLRSQVHP